MGIAFCLISVLPPRPEVGGLLPVFGPGVNKGLCTSSNGGNYTVKIFKTGDKQAKLIGTKQTSSLVSFALYLTGHSTCALVLVIFSENKLTVKSVKSGNGTWSLSIKNNTVYVTSTYSSSILNVRIIPLNFDESLVYAVESNDDLTSPDFEIGV